LSLLNQFSQGKNFRGGWLFEGILPFNRGKLLPEIFHNIEMHIPAVKGLETWKSHVFPPAV
jgi:hypothetical protein